MINKTDFLSESTPHIVLPFLLQNMCPRLRRVTSFKSSSVWTAPFCSPADSVCGGFVDSWRGDEELCPADTPVRSRGGDEEEVASRYDRIGGVCATEMSGMSIPIFVAPCNKILDVAMSSSMAAH